jgi:hypothetical protein
LGLRRVRELERAQEESPGVEFDGGDAGRHGGTITAEARRDPHPARGRHGKGRGEGDDRALRFDRI